MRDALLLTIAKTQEEKAALAEIFDVFFKSPEPRNLEEASKDADETPKISPATMRAKARARRTPASLAISRAC